MLVLCFSGFSSFILYPHQEIQLLAATASLFKTLLIGEPKKRDRGQASVATLPGQDGLWVLHAYVRSRCLLSSVGLRFWIGWFSFVVRIFLFQCDTFSNFPSPLQACNT